MKRSQALDVLRIIAVFMVLSRHVLPCPESESPVVHFVTEFLGRGGWVGVDLFFVLSGFLVSTLLFSEFQIHGSISFRRFFARRGLRIYPMFFLLIAVTVGKELSRQGEFRLRELLSEIFFLQSYIQGMWSHTWSLAVEEHFYILLPLLLIGMLRSRRSEKNPFSHLPYVCMAVASFCLGLRVLNAYHCPFDLKTHLHHSHIRLDALFFGVLLSYCQHFHRDMFTRVGLRFRRGLFPLGFTCLAPAFLLPLNEAKFIYTFGLTLFYIGSGMLVVAAATSPRIDNRIVRYTGFLGSHSYSIYLWHGPALVWGTIIAERISGSRSWWTYASVYWIGSFGLGTVLSILLEKPCLAFRDRYFPSRSSLNRATSAHAAIALP